MDTDQGNYSQYYYTINEKIDGIFDLYYIFVFFFGVMINLMAAIVSTGNFQEYTLPTKKLIRNMILADLTMVCTGTYFKMKRKLHLVSHLGCTIFFTLDVMLLHVSVFTIAVISLLRYIHITRAPLFGFEAHTWIKHTGILSGICWVLPFIVALPMIFNSASYADKCYLTFSYHAQTLYNIFLFVTSFALPGVVITFVYSHIVSKVRAVSSTPSERRQHGLMMRFLVCIVMTFWVFHIPFWYCYLTATFGMETCSMLTHQIVVSISYLNAIANPFIYSLLSPACLDLSCSTIWYTPACAICWCFGFLLGCGRCDISFVEDQYAGEDIGLSHDDPRRRGIPLQDASNVRSFPAVRTPDEPSYLSPNQPSPLPEAASTLEV